MKFKLVVQFTFFARSPPEFHRNAPCSLLRRFHHTPDRLHQSIPTILFCREVFFALHGEALIPCPLLVFRQFPFGLDPSPFAQTMQRGIERAMLYLQHVLGTGSDGHADSMSMLSAESERAQNQHIESTLQKFDLIAHKRS